MSRQILLPGLACLALGAVAGPQQRPNADSDAGRRITLDVVVTDNRDQPVAGLEEQNFTVVDNKQPQKLLSFQAVQGTADPPAEIILLIDGVNSSLRSVASERDQGKKFLRQNGGQLPLPVSIIFFSDAGATVPDATRDGNALIAVIDQSETAIRSIRKSQGIYGAEDRVQLSLSTLSSIAEYEKKKPGRKLLIWLSPGWPLLSGPNIQLSSKQQDEIFGSIVAISTALRQARIALYSVDPLGVADAAGFRTSYYREFLKGVSTARRAQEANLALQVLASQSGGRVLNSSNDITSEIARCADDAKSYYVLSFDSPTADGPNEFHALDVRVGKPGLKAQTRNGYYAQP